ncbi:MAG TPA: hypothetical protein VJN44_00940, partial [Roseateles sp.]|nr:hypothetical protein [Roseateles sp.]
DFALLGLWMAASAVVSVLVSLRYETTLVLPDSAAEAAALYRLAARVIAGLSLALAGLALVLQQWLPRGIDALGLGGLSAWLPWAVLAGGCSAWMGLSLAWLNRQQAYGAMNRARLVQAGLTVVGVTLSGSLDWHAGLWVSHGLGAFGGACAAALALRADLPPRTLAWRDVARRHRAAPLYLLPSALMDTVTQQLPLLLALQWFGSQPAGQFTLAWRALALPMFMAAAAVGAVFYQRFARLASQPAAARALLRKTWGWGLLGWALLCIAMVLMAEPLFGWVFGAIWQPAGAMAAVLTPMVAAMALSSATSGALIVLGGQRYVPLFGLAMLLGRPLVFWWGSGDGDLLAALRLWVALEMVLIVLYNALIWRRLRVA